jgi:predicted membrane protein
LLIFLIPGLLAYFLMGQWAIIVLSVLGILILLAGILTINSIYAVFAQAVWILFFRQIALPKEEEKVVEIATEIKPVETTEVPA